MACFEEHDCSGEPLGQPRDDHELKAHSVCLHLQGPDAPNPCIAFSETQMPDFLLETIQKMKFVDPSPIQAQAWPAALSGRDVV